MKNIINPNNENQFDISDENELLATKDELKFIFYQAESQLKESIGSGDNVLTRSTILLSILLGVLTSIIGYLVGVFSTTPVITKVIAALIIAALFTAFIIYKLVYNIRGSDYQTTGSQPKDLFHNWYFDNHKNESIREKLFMIYEIKSYQERMNHNNRLNKTRWNCFHLSLTLTVLIPVVFIFCYMALSIFLRS